MSIEQKINYQLNKYPKVKKYIKRAYQRTMYAISPKIKSEGDITRVSPNDPNHEYFFGYYDKSPWDITDRYMLCMRAKDTWSDVSPKEPADILLIDTSLPETDKKRVRKIASTHSWNVQQSCMLQWLGPDFSSKILYNDFRDDKYVSVIHTLSTGEEKVIPAPVYTVSADGKLALTLDFSRLYNLRPGYGYYNVPETTQGIGLPDTTAVWSINLETGEVKDLLKYTDFASFHPRKEMLEAGSVHKVNHLMLSPSGKRFMVLYRWFNGQRKYTRLITCNVDGTDMYVLSDDDMVSHCFWKSDEQILAFENKRRGGPGYYLMKDKTLKYIHRWPELSNDGHPSYSPDRSLIVTDTYPDRARMQEIKIMNGQDNHDNTVKVIARVFSPFKYDNDTRCDLHPRWNHAGDAVCFDSVFEGHRGLYVVKVPPLDSAEKNHSSSVNVEEKNEKPLLSVIVPVFNTSRYLERCVSTIEKQTYEKIEILLIDDGSSDNSGAICDKLAKYNTNIKVIHKENGGLSSARNVGLKIANGDYITFVDSDDWLNTHIYSYAMATLIQDNSDVLDFGSKFSNDSDYGKEDKITDKGKQIVLGRDNILMDYLDRGQYAVAPFSVWHKIYRRVLFENVSFPEGRLNEDIVTNFRALGRATKMTRVSCVGYYYYQNNNSISNGKFKSKDEDLLYASQALISEANKTGNKKIIQLANIKMARSYFSLLARMARYGTDSSVKNADELQRRYLTALKKNYSLLMRSKAPASRKVLFTLFCIDYKGTSKMLRKM